MKRKYRSKSPKNDGKRRSKSLGKCRKYLGKKIGINMSEYKSTKN